MRGRWQTISYLWEEHKTRANRMNLLERLDYHRELSSQLDWQRDPGERPNRVVYTRSGVPTAALPPDDDTLVDTTAYWITCRDSQEAHYLLAVINSDMLATTVNKFTTANWAGNTRDLHKHLWKLPIPEYDGSEALHGEIAAAGEAAAAGAARELARLRADRGNDVGSRIARRELRKWLRESEEGKAVEAAVGRLLG